MRMATRPRREGEPESRAGHHWRMLDFMLESVLLIGHLHRLLQYVARVRTRPIVGVRSGLDHQLIQILDDFLKLV